MDTETADSEDTILWRAVREDGDRDAFTQVYLTHAERVFHYCFSRTASVSDAEDLTSIVFLEMWRCRRRITVHADGTVLPWLYGTATNFIRKNAHARRRHQRTLRKIRPESVADPSDDVAARVDDERRMGQILEEVGGLSECDQEILALCVWEGLSTQTAADALDVPLGTAKARLSRARAHLRNAANHSEQIHLKEA